MNCPLHDEDWLFEDDFKTYGWCPRCNHWYRLEELKEEE